MTMILLAAAGAVKLLICQYVYHLFTHQIRGYVNIFIHVSSGIRRCKFKNELLTQHGLNRNMHQVSGKKCKFLYLASSGKQNQVIQRNTFSRQKHWTIKFKHSDIYLSTLGGDISDSIRLIKSVVTLSKTLKKLLQPLQKIRIDKYHQKQFSTKIKKNESKFFYIISNLVCKTNETFFL